MKRRLAAAAAAIAVVAASAVAMQGTSEAAVLPNNFKSVGYMPSWAGSVNSIQYGKLTHINYAFVLPNANGTLQGVPDPAKLQSLVSLGHQNNVKVGLALGGWNDGNDSAFEALAGNSGARTTFVNAVLGLVTQYNLDSWTTASGLPHRDGRTTARAVKTRSSSGIPSRAPRESCSG